MRLRGARALVTGGSAGIGLATARLLAESAADVTVVGSNAQRVESAAMAVTGAGVACDFSNGAAVSGLAGRLAVEPVFDVVVHSAGIGLRGPAQDVAADDLDRLLAVNVRAPILLTRALLPAMVRRGSGRLVFVGSIAGAVGAAGEAAYAATKAALQGYADSLRAELAGTGVGVTVLLPGVVGTDFFQRRGVPYHRSRPKPVPVQRVARKLVRGIQRDRNLVVAPGWLRLPIALQGSIPQTYDRLAGRWGR